MLKKIFHFTLKFKKKIQYYSNTCNAILALLHIKLMVLKANIGIIYLTHTQ